MQRISDPSLARVDCIATSTHRDDEQWSTNGFNFQVASSSFDFFAALGFLFALFPAPGQLTGRSPARLDQPLSLSNPPFPPKCPKTSRIDPRRSLSRLRAVGPTLLFGTLSSAQHFAKAVYVLFDQFRSIPSISIHFIHFRVFKIFGTNTDELHVKRWY